MENEQIISIVSGLPYPCVAISMRDFERILCANPEAKAFLGDGIEGRHFYTVFRQPTMIEAIEGAIKSGERKNARVTISENRRDAFYDATCINIAGQYCLVIFQDRSDQEQIQQMRRDFVANVSHELRSPLTAVLGFIETLRGPAREDAEARDRFLGIMEEQALRISRLVGDLLSLSRVESEERVRPAGEVNLRDVISGVLTTLRPQAEEQGSQMTLEADEGDYLIRGDRDQLTQVFTNLTENALKYGGPGRAVTVRLETGEGRGSMRGPVVRAMVVDRGEGIDPLHLPRLTERFYRVDSHRSREMGGTGLGLAIVKHIVNRHRGRLRIRSEKGKGSTFTVVLPK